MIPSPHPYGYRNKITLLGAELRTIAEGDFPAGYHSFNCPTSALPKGVYCLRFRSNATVRTRLLVVQ